MLCVCVCVCDGAVGLLAAIVSRTPATVAPPATGGGLAPPPGEIAGMVYCLIRGDDAAFDSFTCTGHDPSHSATAVKSVVAVYSFTCTDSSPLHNATGVEINLCGTNGNYRVPGCAAHDPPHGECRMAPTMSDQDVAECKVMVARDYPGGGDCGCNQGTCDMYCEHGRQVEETVTCSTPIVSNPGCTSHTSPRAGCHMALTMSDADVATCKAQATKNGWDPRGCEHQHLQIQASTTCSRKYVNGSFEWKMGYAARQGCTPVGGVSFDPAAKDAATTGMIQGMFCPGSMQLGAPPKVDISGDVADGAGALKGRRAWGDCYVPQTVLETGHAVERGV